MQEVAPHWQQLAALADQLAQPGLPPGEIAGDDWKIIDETQERLLAAGDWEGLLRLRNLFTALLAQDSVTGLPVLQRLDDLAISAARQLGNQAELGHLLGARGHNLHRQGFHERAIAAFDESAKAYWGIGKERPGLESYYMESLCYRAVGKRTRAKEILADVLARIDPQDPWRGNPLQVLAWLLQDEGRLADAEALLREALELEKKTADPDMLVAGNLADLAELVGILGRTEEARGLFNESLAIFDRHQGQYERQEARTLLKYSELWMHQKDFERALEMLNRADDKIRKYGHYYDLLWQIELAKAFIYLRKRELRNCLLKLRSTFRLRHILGLSNLTLAQFVARRYLQRLLRARRL